MPRGIRVEPVLMPTSEDALYAAGFIDGEGCITVRINESNRRMGWQGSCYASLTVSQTVYNKAVLDWLSQRWGGPVRKMAAPRNENWAQGYEWCIVGQMFYRCMDDVLPHLKIKRDAAMNALRLREMRKARGSGQKLTEEELSMHHEIAAESKRLNQRRR